MTERALRTTNVTAGAVLIGGVFIAISPQHAVSIIDLVIVTVAGAAGLHALAVNVPPTGWISPFKWMSPFAGKVKGGRREKDLHEIHSIRSKLSGRRQPVGDAPPLPPDTLRLLRPLIQSALDLDPKDPAPLETLRGKVSPVTLAVLDNAPLKHPHWFQTAPPDEEEVADCVHRVLDDLERLTGNAIDAPEPLDRNHGPSQ